MNPSHIRSSRYGEFWNPSPPSAIGNRKIDNIIDEKIRFHAKTAKAIFFRILGLGHGKLAGGCEK